MKQLFENYQELYEAGLGVVGDKAREKYHEKTYGQFSKSRNNYLDSSTDANLNDLEKHGKKVNRDHDKIDNANARKRKAAKLRLKRFAKTTKGKLAIGAGAGAAIGAGYAAHHISKKKKENVSESQLFESFYDLVVSGYSNLYEAEDEKKKDSNHTKRNIAIGAGAGAAVGAGIGHHKALNIYQKLAHKAVKKIGDKETIAAADNYAKAAKKSGRLKYGLVGAGVGAAAAAAYEHNKKRTKKDIEDAVAASKK